MNSSIASSSIGYQPSQIKMNSVLSIPNPSVVSDGNTTVKSVVNIAHIDTKNLSEAIEAVDDEDEDNDDNDDDDDDMSASNNNGYNVRRKGETAEEKKRRKAMVCP
jgi:hypothetical protein